MSRLLFIIKLSKFKKNIKIAFKKNFLFTRINQNIPSAIIETKDNIYAIKLCGFLRKLTDVKFETNNIWIKQGNLVIGGSQTCKPKIIKQKEFVLNSELETSLKNLKIIYLFIPSALSYSIKFGSEYKYVSYGELIAGGYLHNSKSFLKLLKKEVEM